MASLEEKWRAIKEAAESDLLFFIKLVAPHRMLGSIHEELIQWWTRQDASSHQLVLLPRGHQKSMLVAYRAAWEITRNPDTTILYISSTSNLAEKQLKSVQDILTSKQYRKYWPEMVEEQEGKREKWTTSEFAVDHPKRKLEAVRDPTMFAAGLTTSITGMHCEIAILDDVVVQENAYTEEGRSKVRTQYSLLSSIENPDAREWVVGTRYHPSDLYSSMMEMAETIYDENGEPVDTKPVYEIFERKVEDNGDGTGQFLWPRQRRDDGKWYGFNIAILSKKKEQYLDKTQFYSQYYNNPNSSEAARITKGMFQYYEPRLLKNIAGTWWYKDSKLNVYCGMDLAFSVGKRSDYTVLVVLGIDSDKNLFILDIDRFQTEKIREYYNHILPLYSKWGFRKMRIEATAAQRTIVEQLKDVYFKPNGLLITVDEYKPGRGDGSKEERIAATLDPLYSEGKVWHYKGGNTQILEDELVQTFPPHDDVKDTLSFTVGITVPPARVRRVVSSSTSTNIIHPRFGGIRA